MLMENPEAGKVIQGTNGCRKVRLRSKPKGKSGSYRVIYFYVRPDVIHLLMLYKKSQQGNIDKADKEYLKRAVKEIKESR